MSFRRAAKKDGNQTEIVEALRALGYDVDIVHQLKNLYDLVITGTRRGESVAVRVEVKMPGGRLTPGELEYWQKQRHPDNLIIAESVEDVLRWFEAA